MSHYLCPSIHVPFAHVPFLMSPYQWSFIRIPFGDTTSSFCLRDSATFRRGDHWRKQKGSSERRSSEGRQKEPSKPEMIKLAMFKPWQQKHIRLCMSRPVAKLWNPVKSSFRIDSPYYSYSWIRLKSSHQIIPSIQSILFFYYIVIVIVN